MFSRRFIVVIIGCQPGQGQRGKAGIGSPWVITDQLPGIGINLLGLFPANLSAVRNNLSLSADSIQTVRLTLKSSSLLGILPSVQSSKLSVSIHH